MPHSRLRTPLLILLLTVLLAPAMDAVASQESTGVSISVTPALASNAKYSEWMALRVSLANTGGDVNDAEVQADVTGNNGRALYTLPVSLPAGARKEVTLYITPPTFGQAVDVQVVSAGRRLALAKVPITLHQQNEFLIGAVAPDPGALALLNGLTLGQRGQVHMLPLQLDDLPERFEALRSLDALILCGTDSTALTPAQGQALEAWVESGGRLVLGGGAGAERVLAGLPAALQIVQLGQPSELASLAALAAWAGQPIQVPGPFLATFPSGDPARPAIVQDGQPLLIQSALGSGRVYYLALDPTGSPFNAWSGALPFWTKVFGPGSALADGAPTDVPLRALESQQISQALYNLPGMDPPSLTWLALLLGAYIVLVGPVNYVVLRRWFRLSWAWLTIPVLTIAFAIAGFILGYQMRGSDMTLQQISVVETHGGGRPAVRSYIGLFSPTRASYDVRIDGDVLLSPLYSWNTSGDPDSSSSQAVNLVQGNPAQVRRVEINQWAMYSVEAEAMLDPALGLEATVSVEGKWLKGSVRNNLGQPLHDLAIISGHLFARLGDLAAGEERQFEVALTSDSSGNGFPMSVFELPNTMTALESRELSLRSQILDSCMQASRGIATAGLVLIGWSDWAPVDVQVDGVRTARSQATLVVNRLALPVSPGGRVDLPPGFISPRLSASEGDAGMCGPASFFIGSGQVTLDYVLPQELPGLTITGLTLSVGALYGPATGSIPDLALYDWTAQDWVRLPDVTINVPLEVADPTRFVDPATGMIRLQVDAGNPNMMKGGDCLEYDLGIQGTLPAEGGQ